MRNRKVLFLEIGIIHSLRCRNKSNGKNMSLSAQEIKTDFSLSV